ncbi:MAG: replicative DNA helicase [Pseudomonadales bacterium]|nr:replicative DNA helicase [Pseudomonadales bacterium]
MRDREVAEIAMPPHSIEAEQAVLGGLLLDANAWENLAEIVSEADFYRHDHRLLFRAIVQLIENQQACDALTLANALTAQGHLDEAGGLPYIGELVKNTPSAANIRSYGKIVRERSVRRQLARVAHEVADSAFRPDGRSPEELLDEAERRIFEIAEQQQHGTGPQAVNPLLKAALKRIDELYHSGGALTGLTTGFDDLDERTTGMQRGDLIIIAARPSMGKTTFAMNIVENALLSSSKPILVFSMEMPAEQLIMRILASLGRIDQTRLRTGVHLQDEDWSRLTSAVSLIQGRPLYIDDSPALTPTELRARSRRLARDMGGQLGLIMIDYLQLMRVPDAANNRVNEISEISRSLKALAKEMGCPVVALSQLSRAVESRPNKRPVMSDLRESGAIEQDADLIMCIYRDEVYTKEESKEKGIAEIIIVKQRNGPIGTVRLAFQGQFSRFENLAAEYQRMDDD